MKANRPADPASPADPALVMDAFRALLRTARRLRRITGPILAEWGLTGAQFGSLSRIPPEGISLTELAAMSSADPATVSGIVDRLVRDGFISRERSAEDRRAVHITLTEKGKETLAAVIPIHRRAVSEALGPMDEESLRALLSLLGRIEAHLDGPARATPREARREVGRV